MVHTKILDYLKNKNKEGEIRERICLHLLQEKRTLNGIMRELLGRNGRILDREQFSERMHEFKKILIQSGNRYAHLVYVHENTYYRGKIFLIPFMKEPLCFEEKITQKTLLNQKSYIIPIVAPY